MTNPYASPKADLASGHGSEIEYTGFWLRVAASILDSILVLGIIIPLLFMIYGKEGLMDETQMSLGVNFLVQNVLPAVIVILFWIYKSATPGKMLLKARIVDAKTGEQPSVGQFVVRYFGYIVSSIPLGLGLLWVAWDKRKQGWHDKMAGTVVVRPSKGKGIPAQFEI